MIPVIPIAFMFLRQSTMTAENRVRDGILIPAPYRAAPDDVTVSVIIIAYNEEKRLPATLAALGHQTRPPDEVIVVDNLSDDQTIPLSQTAGAVVATNDIFNLARSRNIGAAVSKGDLLIFLDADTVPEPTAIETMVESYREGAVLIHTNLVTTDNHMQSMLRNSLGMIYGIIALHHPHGCFTAISRECFDKVDGYNELIDSPGEDMEIGERIFNEYGREQIYYLKDIYAGTSARRQLEEGYFAKFRGNYWNERAIR